MTGIVQASVANQQITNTSGGVTFNISSTGDTIVGGVGDTFVINSGYTYYNSITEISGGQILAGVNNAFIGLDGNFSAATNGITAIAGNGYTGVTVSDDSAVFNLSGVALSNVTIAANKYTAQTITSTSVGGSYLVSGNNATINAAGHDTFTVVTPYASEFNTYNEPTGGVILAGINNAFIGMGGNVVAGNGIAAILSNGFSGAMLGGNGAVLNLAGVRISGVAIDADQANQTITTTQGNVNYTVSTAGDTFNGVGGDVFSVVDPYNNYNAYNDLSGGTVQAGTNNALLAFSNSLTAADGIATLSANGHTGVRVGSQGAVLNTTGIALSGVGISLDQNGQTVTVPQSGLSYTVSTYGDTINAGGGDTFTVVDSYIDYNVYNDVAGGTLQAGTNNALLGFSNSLTAADGISTLSANGHTGVNVASNGAVLNLTGITLNGVGVSLAQTGQTVVAPQSGLNYVVSNWNDIITGGGHDTFTVVDAYNNFNSYSDTSGGTLQAGVNNALLGFSNNLTAADGIATLSANGYTGVNVASQGAILDLTGITLNGVGISAGQSNQTITAPQSGLNYRVSNTADTFNGGGNDIFTVMDVYNYNNTYNDISGGTIQAGMNNAVIGLAGSFGAGNGIATIAGNGYSGVVIQGLTAGATLDFSQTIVSGAAIRGAANNVTIIGPSGNQTLTGGGQSDVFAFTVGTGNDVITDFRAGSGGGYDVIDLNGSLSVANFATLLTHIQQVGANAVISLNNGGTITLNNVSVASLKANNFNLSNLVSGLAAANGALTIGHGQSVDLTSAINGLITQGKLGGVATVTTLTALSAATGIASVAAGDAQYTAPANGSDTLAYTAEDQFGDLVSGKLAVTVDAGPTAANAALTTNGSSVDVTATLTGLIAAGIAGDVETITAVSGNAKLNANGSVTYTPTSAASSSFTYTVTDEYGDSATGAINVTQVQPAPVVASHANTVVNLSGNNDVVQGPAMPLAAGGDITITARGYANTIVANGGNDTINAGLDGAHVTVSDANGRNDVGDLLGTLANNTLIMLGNGDDHVSLRGYSNTISLGNGNNTVNAGAGFEKVALGNGNNSIAAGGYGNTISVGTGSNVVDAGIGNNTVTVAGGSATVTATGYSNVITTGTGNSTINAGAGNETVSVGTGTNAIVAAGNGNTITTAGGLDTVVLSGWNNTVNAGSGLTVVTGGYENLYNVTALGTSGGLQITDFNVPYGDVLNLDAVLKPLAVGGMSLSSLVSASAVGHDMLISVATAGGPMQVADLKGLASASLTGLIGSHNIVL